MYILEGLVSQHISCRLYESFFVGWVQFVHSSVCVPIGYCFKTVQDIRQYCHTSYLYNPRHATRLADRITAKKLGDSVVVWDVHLPLSSALINCKPGFIKVDLLLEM